MRYVLTGAAGSIGRALADKLLNEDDVEVHLIDRDENGLMELLRKYRSLGAAVTGHAVDLSDSRFANIGLLPGDVVFHLAAAKHVEFGEVNPLFCARQNVDATARTLELVAREPASAFVYASSDKAVFPTTVMGATKLLGERVVAQFRHQRRVAAVSVRFGNVLLSSGSVFSIFRDQLNRGLPITVTEPSMTRFVMTMNEACELLIYAASVKGSCELVTKRMPAATVRSFACAALVLWGNVPEGVRARSEEDEIWSYGCERGLVKIVGPHPQEKGWEELLTDGEYARSTFSGGIYHVDTNAVSTDQTPTGTSLNSSTTAALSLTELLDLVVNGR